MLEPDPPAHHHEEHARRDDVHRRRRERDSPDPEPVEHGVEHGVERHRPERDPGRHPVRLHCVEAPVEDEHPAVEDETDRERLQALGDDHGVVGSELSALVDEAHDRLREDDREQAGGHEEEGDLAHSTVEGAPEPGHIAARCEASERREEHRRHSDREDALREHVQPERLVDGRGCELRVEQPRREQRVDQEVHVHEADRQRDRQHQDEHALDGRIAPVDDHRQPAVEPAQPRDRQEELYERADHDHRRVQVELRALVVDLRHAEEEPHDDHRVPGDGRERRNCELVVRVEDPDDDPGQAEEDDDREEDSRETDREVVVAAGVSERAQQERRKQDEERRDAAEDEEGQPEERRRDAPARAGARPSRAAR